MRNGAKLRFEIPGTSATAVRKSQVNAEKQTVSCRTRVRSCQDGVDQRLSFFTHENSWPMKIQNATSVNGTTDTASTSREYSRHDSVNVFGLPENERKKVEGHSSG